MERKLSIPDLPLEITTHILENLEPWDFVQSRRVCKGFKEVVDHHLSLRKSWNFHCEADGETEVAWDNPTSYHYCVYSKTDSGCKALLSIEGEDIDGVLKIKKTFKGKDPSEIGIEHFGLVARNPVVRLNKCCLGLDAAHEELFFKKVFERMEHKLNTKYLHFYGTPMSIIRRVLSHVQPGFLEKICICDSPEGDEGKKAAKEIAEMDHWKLAKNLSSGGFGVASSFPIDDLLHADVFDIDLAELTVDDLVRVKEKLVSSPNFKEALIRCWEYLPIDEFAAGLGPPVIRDEDSPDCISYNITGTEEYLDFQFQENKIKIKRS